MKPLAIIPVYNEADILPWTVKHLFEQGCDVHIVDNWSTDGSVSDAALAAMDDPYCLLTSEQWPAAGPDPTWQWMQMLQHIEQIAAARDSWVLFNDADEIRRSPRAGETIAEGLARIEAGGYNAVNFRVYEFWPVDDSYRGDPEQHFEYYRDGVDAHLPHIKAWHSELFRRVDLHLHGGHQVIFTGRKVAPEPWILKHYPMRTHEQGARKLLNRRARYAPAELARNWHVQYEGLGHDDVIRDPQSLRRFA